MISWTETTDAATVPTSQYSSSSTYSESGGGFLERVDGIFGCDGYTSTASESYSRSVNASNQTYETKIARDFHTVDFDTSFSYFYSIAGNTTVSETRLPNGQGTYSSLVEVSGTMNQNESYGLDTTSSTSVTSESSSATRASQTTVAESFASAAATTTIVSFATTIPTVASSKATSTTATSSSNGESVGVTSTVARTRTVTTSSESAFTKYQATNSFGGVGIVTHYLPEPGEVIWNFTTAGNAQALDAVAISHSVAFSKSKQLTKTSSYKVSTSALFELSETSENVTSTVFDSGRTTTTLAFGTSIPLPAFTFVMNRATTATLAVEKTGQSIVFGDSLSAVELSEGTFHAKAGGQNYQDTYMTSQQGKRMIGGLVLSPATSSSGETTVAGEEGYTIVYSSSSSESATVDNQIMTYGAAGFSNTAMRDVETVLGAAWVAVNSFFEPASAIGLSPAMTLPIKQLPESAAPNVFLAFPTINSSSNSSGKTTWSVGPSGVTQSSIGTASTASLETSTAAWTKNGQAITVQYPNVGVAFYVPSLASTATDFDYGRMSAAGGIPATGDTQISAILPAGKFITICKDSSGTVNLNSATTYAGTAASAFAAQPLYVSVVGGGDQQFVTKRNPFSSRSLLPFYGSFFPL